MQHPKFKMYGPEHHVLTPAVILTSLKNNDIKKYDGTEITQFDIKEAIRRASKDPERTFSDRRLLNTARLFTQRSPAESAVAFSEDF